MNGPALANDMLVVLAAATLMLLSGLGKRRLEWRPRAREANRQRLRLRRLLAAVRADRREAGDESG